MQLEVTVRVPSPEEVLDAGHFVVSTPEPASDQFHVTVTSVFDHPVSDSVGAAAGAVLSTSTSLPADPTWPARSAHDSPTPERPSAETIDVAGQLAGSIPEIASDQFQVTMTSSLDHPGFESTGDATGALRSMP